MVFWHMHTSWPCELMYSCSTSSACTSAYQGNMCCRYMYHGLESKSCNATMLKAYVWCRANSTFVMTAFPVVLMDIFSHLAKSDLEYFRESREKMFGTTLEDVSHDMHHAYHMFELSSNCRLSSSKKNTHTAFCSAMSLQMLDNAADQYQQPSNNDVSQTVLVLAH